MNYLFFLIVICSAVLSGYAQQTIDKDPVVSINLETDQIADPLYTFHGKDSIITGISRKAKYF